jgi:hypothetical protein
MGFNKRVLSKAVSELGKAKAPAKPRDIITDPAGQWKYPGQKTRIPGNDITMQGVNYPVWAQPNVGPGTLMQPGQDYNFPDADYVDETPLAKKGGTLKSKKYSKSMSATNKLFTKNKLFQNKKSKIFDPNAKFQDGGQSDGLYTHSGHNYKKIDGKWYIEPVENSGKYKLIEKGNVKSRIAELEKNAQSYRNSTPEQVTANRKRLDSQPQSAGSADWFWTLPIAGPAALEAAGSLGAMQLPGLSGVSGATLGNAANAGFIAHGITQTPETIKAWNDVSKGKKKWQDAALETGINLSEFIGSGAGIKSLAQDVNQGGKYLGKTLGTESGLLSKVDKAIYPTRTYRAHLPGGNETSYEASELAKKINKKGDWSTKDLTEAQQYLAGTEAFGRKKGLLTGNDMLLTEYKVPFWKRNVSYDKDVKALKKLQNVDVNPNEFIIPNNKFLYPRRTNLIKAVPEELKNFEEVLPNGYKTNMYSPNGIPFSYTSTQYASKPYQYIEDQINAVTGHDMPLTYKFNQELGWNQNVPMHNWTQKQFAPNKGLGKFNAKELPGSPNTLQTPAGFQNRVFDSNIQLGSFKGKGHLSEKGYNYRTLGDAEIKAIQESKGVFPKTGKAKGGNENVKYWTKGNEKNWYAENPNQQVIRIKDNKFSTDKVADANDIEIYNHETGAFESIIPESKSIQKLTKGKASINEVKNTFTPNSLINHSDNKFILQNTPVKASGITPKIKNLPTIETHGFEVTQNEVQQLIDQNIEYLQNPEYIKRRIATTGETQQTVEKDIEKYIRRLKNSIIDLNSKDIRGEGLATRGKEFLKKPLIKSKIHVASSNNTIKSKEDVLHILDHEIKHILSPATETNYALRKYKNYPHIDIKKGVKNENYIADDAEQQVRYLRIKDYLNNKYGVSKNSPISEQDWELFRNDLSKWANEQHAGLEKGQIPIGLKDVEQLLLKRSSDVTSEDLRRAINKAWGIVPIAGTMGVIGAGALKQQKTGGVTETWEDELSDEEIEELRKAGYIIEELD